MSSLSWIRRKVLSISLLALAVLHLHTGRPDEHASEDGMLRSSPSSVNKTIAVTNQNIKTVSKAKKTEEEKKKKKYRSSSKTSSRHPHIDYNANETVTAIKFKFNPIDLDTSKQINCGWHKCFYPSKSDRHFGYLIARAIASSGYRRRGRLQSLESAWQLAKHLENEYGMKHFLLAPPINITVNKRLSSLLNVNLKSETNSPQFRRRAFRLGMPAFVQKVKTAPKHTLLIGCKDSKVAIFDKAVEKFVGHIHNKTSFVQHFTANFADARDLLHKEPCLLLDFQVLVDTRGTVYHLDFDRCFKGRSGDRKHGPKPEKVKESECFLALEMFERKVIRAVEKLGKK